MSPVNKVEEFDREEIMKYSVNGDENDAEGSYQLDQTLTEEFNEEDKMKLSPNQGDSTNIISTLNHQRLGVPKPRLLLEFKLHKLENTRLRYDVVYKNLLRDFRRFFC